MCKSPAFPADELRTIVDDYLAAHARLATPVAVFSNAHSAESEARLATARSQLIPLSAPDPGEQYAFEVNLDACTGCKACVAACHSLNGLDEGESWRDVGLIHGGDAGSPYLQTITSACHHCADPGCMNGCPVLAYEKDPLSGIVRHLDDQCIGCQYCILKCPYDVPKYNERLGIVRKCDMCHQRLAVGEAPACAQACPTHAIRSVKVPTRTDEVGRPAVATEHFLAAAPSPDSTRPATRYVSKAPIPTNAVAADHACVLPQHLHAPLVLMLALTQAGYGLMAGGLLQGASLAGAHVTVGMTLLLSGLGASAAHLGKPLRMWRVFLNLRRSWLSREALVLGVSFGMLCGALGLSLLPGLPPVLRDQARPLFVAGLASGLVGVFCSAMIYVDTGRRFWRPGRVFTRMGGTVLVCTALCLGPLALGLAVVLKLLGELSVLRSAAQTPGPEATSAILHLGPLRPLTVTRVGLAIAAGLSSFLGCPWWLAGIPLLLGELAERALFFLAVDRSAMPGSAAPGPMNQTLGAHVAP